jgi:hypothetical protein
MNVCNWTKGHYPRRYYEVRKLRVQRVYREDSLYLHIHRSDGRRVALEMTHAEAVMLVCKIARAFDWQRLGAIGVSIAAVEKIVPMLRATIVWEER